ncbi:MAG: hypothetical protein AAF244_02295 [Pseudomonadota bacterium]
MNCKRYALSVIAGFIFVFVFEYMLHGNLLMGLYEQTSNLWRSTEEMEKYAPFMGLVQFLTVVILAFIFTCNFENKGVTEGARFGLLIGLLFGVGMIGMYAYMPIPMALAVAWFIGTLIEMTALGIVFSLTCKEK